MPNNFYFLGIDLGTTGVRITIINENNQEFYSSSMNYPTSLNSSEDWKICCKNLIIDIPLNLKEGIKALAIDGTSGTLLACDTKGLALGPALAYNIHCPEQKQHLAKLIPEGGIASNIGNSFARALRLVSIYGPNIILRHQADWITGWLIQDWQYGEEGNNIRLGWNLKTESWPKSYEKLNWVNALPKIIRSGRILAHIAPEIAQKLGLKSKVVIVAGTTDSNAAVLASDIQKEDGITVLGSTIVLKRYVNNPIKGVGITNHRIEDKWLCGGASNAGGVTLRKFFSDKELKDLSNQINPESNSGLNLRPLPSEGERFPINDPALKPILEPRPISDSLYLHGLLEGLANIEAQGWHKLMELGVPYPKRIITLGGGARNPQWRRIRERALGIPIQTCSRPPALGVARLALRAIARKASKN